MISSWNLKHSRVDSQGTLLTIFLGLLKFALLKSRVTTLLTSFLFTPKILNSTNSWSFWTRQPPPVTSPTRLSLFSKKLKMYLMVLSFNIYTIIQIMELVKTKIIKIRRVKDHVSVVNESQNKNNCTQTNEPVTHNDCVQ